MENNKTFEEALTNLEQIVKELESGNVDLDNAIKKYFLHYQNYRVIIFYYKYTKFILGIGLIFRTWCLKKIFSR